MLGCPLCSRPILTKPGYPDGPWMCPVHGMIATAHEFDHPLDKEEWRNRKQWDLKTLH